MEDEKKKAEPTEEYEEYLACNALGLTCIKRVIATKQNPRDNSQGERNAK